MLVRIHVLSLQGPRNGYEVPMLARMFQKRLRGYRAIGYARGVTPVSLEESSDGAVGGDGEDAPSSFDAPP